MNAERIAEIRLYLHRNTGLFISHSEIDELCHAAFAGATEPAAGRRDERDSRIAVLEARIQRAREVVNADTDDERLGVLMLEVQIALADPAEHSTSAEVES